MNNDSVFKHFETDFSALNPERHFLLKHIGFNKKITKAAGHYYFDAAGNAYLDFLAQYGAIPFGHNAPAVWDVVHAHGHCSAPSFVQPLMSPAAEELAEKLIRLAPGAMRYVTFVNSGAEAVEASIKLARAKTQRQSIVSTFRGYHGKTLGALSATDNAAYREPFLLDTTCFDRIAFDDLKALDQRLSTRDVAAFIVEPVQGEGGMRVPSPNYLRGAAETCRQYGTLFILDEVQTGLGRTGELFAADAEPGLAPDIILLSKALGGGLVPLGAVLCTEKAWSEEFGFYHSSTFANSHFTCAVGSKVLDMLIADDRAIVRHAKTMGDYLQQGLDELVRKHPRAFQSRTGRGLMHGLILVPWRGESSYFTAHATEQGYAVPLLAGYLLNRHRIVTAPVFSENSTLRLEPSLTIERAEIDRLLHALGTAGQLIGNQNFAELLAYVPGEVAEENRSTSVPVSTYDFSIDYVPTYRAPQSTERQRGKFAFLIHPTDDDVLFNTLPPDFANLDLERKSSWRAWMESWFSRMYEPAPVYHLPAIRSAADGYVEGWLIAAPLTPARMMRLRKTEKAALMAAYIDVARKLKVDMTGLGAFTSVISRGGDDLQNPGVNLTSGNSLTAVASAESLRAVVAAHGKNFASQAIAIIGAGGSVGRIAALHLGRFTKQLLLFGNPNNPGSLDKLALIAGEIYRCAAQMALLRAEPGLPELLLDVIGPLELTRLLETVPEADHGLFKRQIEQRLSQRGVATLPIMLSANLKQDIHKADAILSASAAGKSFIDPLLFASDCIVCDVARPLDVMNSVKSQRGDLFVYEGGIMKLPENISFGAQNVLGYPRGYNLACLSETIVLAMESAKRSYSLGSTIDYAEALWIYDKSLHHGFNFAVLRDGIQFNVTPGRMPAHPLVQNIDLELAV